MRALTAAALAAALLAAPADLRAQTETDLSAAEIDALLARLADPADMAVRTAALAALLEAQAGVLELLTNRLFRPNGIAPGLQQRLLEDYVRRLPEELPPESPVPPRTSLAPLLHLLVIAPHETYRESWAAALQAVALLAALDVIDTNEALMETIRFVSRYDGAFGKAVGILVRSKGDRAIPALVRSRKIQDGNVKAFVADQLARMGKERAPLMAQVNDDQILADILRAIAEVRDSEGVNALAGANFELGELVRGEIGLGYIEQRFDDPQNSRVVLEVRALLTPLHGSEILSRRVLLIDKPAAAADAGAGAAA